MIWGLENQWQPSIPLYVKENSKALNRNFTSLMTSYDIDLSISAGKKILLNFISKCAKPTYYILMSKKGGMTASGAKIYLFLRNSPVLS